MTDAQKESVSELSTAELVEELSARCQNLAITYIDGYGENTDQVTTYFSGGIHSAIGMTIMLTDDLRAAVMDHEEQDCTDE